MLRVTLHVNADLIGDYEVRNSGPCPCSDNCVMHSYEVRAIVNDRTAETLLMTVSHDRNYGAEALAAQVLDILASNRIQLGTSQDEERS